MIWLGLISEVSDSDVVTTNRLLTFFIDTPERVQQKLQVIMEGTEFADRLPPIFARIKALVSYIHGFDVKRKVYINPLASLNDKFFRGSILFQCIFDGKRRDVFAAGGRYDKLIQEFSPKLLFSRSQAHAVGFNLSWDRLSSSMVDLIKNSTRAFTKHSENEIESFWRSRRVCFHSILSSRSNTDLNYSVMSSLQASIQLSFAQLECELYKTFGRMT
jgi:histidyl-tRNA synthetase